MIGRSSLLEATYRRRLDQSGDRTELQLDYKEGDIRTRNKNAMGSEGLPVSFFSSDAERA